MPNQIDLRPGNYYVSAVNGPRVALLLGPYPSHAEALAMVNTGNRLACQVDERAHWYGFGTVRIVTETPRTGVLMKMLEVKNENHNGPLRR